MIRSIVRILTVLALPGLAYACGGEDAGTPSAPDPATSETGVDAYDMDIVSGSAQNGRTGMWFPEFLGVLVTDRHGEPVAGATVDWSVVEGPLEVTRETTRTNRYGRAKITLRAAPELGSGRVRASLREAPGVEVHFQEEVSAVQVIMKSDQYSEMTFQSEPVVQVGDTIEWLNKDMADTHGGDAAMHTATSITGPEGGKSFDSGKLRFNETFRWAPNTTGRWEYHCDDHPQAERMYGSIKVVAKE